MRHFIGLLIFLLIQTFSVMAQGNYDAMDPKIICPCDLAKFFRDPQNTANSQQYIISSDCPSRKPFASTGGEGFYLFGRKKMKKYKPNYPRTTNAIFFN